MVEGTFPKDPNAVLDYEFGWDTWLGTSETISSYTITPDAGITVDSSSESGGIVTAWLSGGTAGEAYIIACKIGTDEGRTDERSIRIDCMER